MSKSNKSVREALEEEFGSKCMYHEGIRRIRPPAVSKRRYRGKKIQDQLTLHHLIPLRKNGPTTKANTAVLCRYCHDFVESLTEADREQVNNELRAYKKSKECAVEYVDYLPLDWEVKAMVISPAELEQKKKYNRAKHKREVRKKIEEWERE